MFDGDNGKSRGSTDIERSAAAIAFPITPPTAIRPPSPAPFAPRGLLGQGRRPSEIPTDIWVVRRGRQKIVSQGAGQQLAVLIVLQVLEKGTAQSLNDGAEDLAVESRRVDDATDIIDRHVIEKFNVSGAGVDRDVSRMAPIAVGQLVVFELPFDLRSGEGRKLDGFLPVPNIAIGYRDVARTHI